MQSKIALPTDNIYKFYAMFGLLILLTSGVMFFMRHEYYNSMAFERYIPLETLKAKNTQTKEEKAQLYLLEQKAIIAKSDEKLELSIYLFFFLFGICLTIYGFHHWQTKIQPKQDKLLDLQIQKIEDEIKVSNRQFKKRLTHH